jgi:hypothetical protein
LIANFTCPAFRPLRLASPFYLLFYGVGAGEGDSEGDASVSAAFFLVAAFFFRGDGDGDAFVVAAAVVEVTVVSFFSAQEVKNAMPIKAVIKNKTDVFIGVSDVRRSRMFSCKSDDKHKSDFPTSFVSSIRNPQSGMPRFHLSLPCS